MAKPDPIVDVPAPEEIRGALDDIVGSDIFCGSPQLGTFLRFVVEAALQGKSDTIKGYTIGVDVLKRGPNFDPQVDPIVRVEATRLRRAMALYYAGPGADAAVVIGLGRGSYVPSFSYRRSGPSAALPRPAPQDLPSGNGMPTLQPPAFRGFRRVETAGHFRRVPVYETMRRLRALRYHQHHCIDRATPGRVSRLSAVGLGRESR